jgi:hypothetical protein
MPGQTQIADRSGKRRGFEVTGTVNLAALFRHPNVILAFLLASFFLFSYRFFLADAYLPLHDTGDTFHVFKTTYSNFYFNASLPEWLPYGVYGYQTHLQNILGLSPFAYPVMAVGKLFGVLDTLFLFRVMIFAEVVVFALGFLRLADELLKNRYLSLLALAPVLLTTPLINQIYFSFRLFYLLPLLAFFGLRFFRTGRAVYIVCAAIVFYASLYGNLIYFSIYYALFCGLLFGLFFIIYRKHFRLVIDRAALVTLAAAVAFIGVGTYLILTSFDQLRFVITERDPDTLKVGLDSFLDYGFGGIVKMFEMLLARPLSTYDTTFYIPAAAFVFAVYAVRRERGRMFLAFAAALAFFLVLAWGRYSPLAYAVYYIPGVSYIRYLGLTFAVPKLLLCLIAGFGVRRFLIVSAEGGGGLRRDRKFLGVVAGLLGFMVAVMLALAVFATGSLELLSLRTALAGLSAAGFLAVAVVCAIPAIRGKAFLYVQAGLIFVQGGIYLMLINALFSNEYAFEPAVKAEVIQARPYVFEETRVAVPAHPRFRMWNAFDPWRYYYKSHTILYGSLGIDPCYPVTPRDMIDNYSPEVQALARRIFGPDVDVNNFGARYKASPDSLFFRLAGCDGRAKLQLINSFEEQTLEPGTPVPVPAMATGVEIARADGTRRFIRSTAGEYPNATSLAAQGITVSHFSANRLELSVTVSGAKGAWLVYADAYHPGWRAAVDGRTATVWKANTAFKAVYLPPGTRAVSFDITDGRWQAAMWFIGLFAAAAMALFSAPGLKQIPSRLNQSTTTNLRN